LAYAGQPVAELHAGETPEAQRRYLFSAYVERMFQRRSVPTRYTRQQTEHWLAWLAWQMTQHSQTVFYLERMQPDWLPQGQRWMSMKGEVLVGQAGGLLIGLGVGVVSGLVSGLVFGLPLGLSLGLGLGIGLGVGVVFGLGVGLIAAKSAAMFGNHTQRKAASSGDIISVESLHWSWSAVGYNLPVIFVCGLAAGLGFRLWLGGLFDGLLAGLMVGLEVALFKGLSGSEIEKKLYQIKVSVDQLGMHYLLGCSTGCPWGWASGCSASCNPG
jgi:hypothetical protein